MGLFGGKKDDTERAFKEAMLGSRDQAPTVFEPQPLEGWDPVDSAGADSPVFGAPDFYLPVAKKPAPKAGSGKGASKEGGPKKGASKKAGPKKPRYEVRPPEPGLSEAERRRVLRAQMADLTRAYKDAPLEEMEGVIRQTLVAHGQDVPDAWVTMIAEGLRRNGPTPLNYDGPGRVNP